jgi:hypothetical protein
LLLKDDKNGIGRIARLELRGERMCKQVVIRALLVFVQGVVEDELKVRGRGGSGLSARHKEANQ